MSRPGLQRGFRQARPASWRWNIAKTLVQTVFFWTFFLAVCPIAIAAGDDWLGIPRFSFVGQSYFAWAVFGVAGSLGLWSGATMAITGSGTPLPLDCPRRLVVAGPYAYVRNPMAIAGLTQGAAVGVLLGSWSILLYTLIGALLWNTWVRPIEEQHLQEVFGEEFEAYCLVVPCWLPRVRPYRP